MLRTAMTRFPYFAFAFGRYWFKAAAPAKLAG